MCQLSIGEIHHFIHEYTTTLWSSLFNSIVLLIIKKQNYGIEEYSIQLSILFRISNQVKEI